ncbi:hypothetical protein BC829DRAFT_269171 [Chytridium lagenaria]|nr:hypothetical protein BC829DRAFT_269171 [Chytridium lagenaria]
MPSMKSCLLAVILAAYTTTTLSIPAPQLSASLNNDGTAIASEDLSTLFESPDDEPVDILVPIESDPTDILESDQFLFDDDDEDDTPVQDEASPAVEDVEDVEEEDEDMEDTTPVPQLRRRQQKVADTVSNIGFRDPRSRPATLIRSSQTLFAQTPPLKSKARL